MKLFKQSYKVELINEEFECKIHLDPVAKISFKDIEQLTGGVLPYSIRFYFNGSQKRYFFDYYQRDGVYKRCDSHWISVPYGMDVEGRVTLQGKSQDCLDDFGVVNVGINTSPKKLVLYGYKYHLGLYSFDSEKESAVSTHKITITPIGYEVLGLGKDRYCRVLDKASEHYGKLFSEVENKDDLMSYYWRYRKKRCIDMTALASALDLDKMGGTSGDYEPKYYCED
jgi:hypothetical protein